MSFALPLKLGLKFPYVDLVAPVFLFVPLDVDSPADCVCDTLGPKSISFPNSLTRPIVSLNDLYIHSNYIQKSIFEFSKSDVTYELIENVLRDLYIQINYLKQIGMTYQNITTKSIYRIQERFILLDSSLLEPLKTETILEQTQRFNKAIVSLISEIIGYEQTDGHEFEAKFNEIQDTRVYYVLKRIEYENVFEWI